MDFVDCSLAMSYSVKASTKFAYSSMNTLAKNIILTIQLLLTLRLTLVQANFTTSYMDYLNLEIHLFRRLFRLHSEVLR